jgi:hypothetical protein
MDGNPGPGGFDRPKCFGLKPLAPLKLKLHFTGADNCCKCNNCCKCETIDFEEASVAMYLSRRNEGATACRSIAIYE